MEAMASFGSACIPGNSCVWALSFLTSPLIAQWTENFRNSSIAEFESKQLTISCRNPVMMGPPQQLGD